MKYLLFNAAVVAALAYIFVGDSDFSMKKVTAPIGDVMNNFSKQEPAKREVDIKVSPVVVKSVKEELSEQEKFILYGEKATKKMEQPVPDASSPKPAEGVRIAKAEVPPLPASIEVPTRVAKPPRTQSEPLHNLDSEQEKPTVDEEQVIVPVDGKERRKNLRRLVADMERLFAEKLSQ
jgi:hypothetical protein